MQAFHGIGCELLTSPCSTVERLSIVRPDWVVIRRESRMMLAFSATPVRSSGRTTRQYDLSVREIAGELVVRENASEPLLPQQCPERHINRDGSFCLGLHAGESVCDKVTAGQWWDKLQVFLICQETANETGDWPTYAELSHGLAGEYQRQAEMLAEELGLIEEYQDAIQGSAGWIADMARQVKPSTLRLRNGRAPCTCGRIDRRGRALLRRDCWNAQLDCLAVLEFQRRQAIDQFWASFEGIEQCCATMRNCPLSTNSRLST